MTKKKSESKKFMDMMLTANTIEKVSKKAFKETKKRTEEGSKDHKYSVGYRKSEQFSPIFFDYDSWEIAE